MTAPEHIGNYRWRILALLFVATTINYMDRSIFGVIGPTLQYKVFNWSDNEFAYINMAFKAAYAVGLTGMGAIIDRVGTRIGYALSIAIWSAFGMLHAVAFNFISFFLIRFGLGVGEGGNFPAANKTVAEWFPQKERAFASGIYVAGSSVGAVLAPTVIPMVVWPDGTHWQYGFLTTGVFSALWVIVWCIMYRRPEQHPRLSPDELAYINLGSPVETAEKVRWRRLLPLPESWAWAALKVPDIAWWFYLFWGGKFFYDQFGLDIKNIALPLIIIYLASDFGSVFGGWLSSYFMRLGWSANRARKTAMLIFALCIVPVTFCTQLGTHFNVDAGFFDRVKTATFTTEKIETVNGERVRHKVEETLPADFIASLHSLVGKSYNSAKEFLTAAAQAYGVVATKSYASAITGAYRPDLTAEELAKSLAATLPDDAVKLLGNKGATKYDSAGQFLSAVNEFVGRAETNHVDAPLVSSARTDSLYWIAVFLMALAGGAHQAWAANVFAVSTDVFPKKAIASITGLGGMAGALASMIADFAVGKWLTNSGPAGYVYAFAIASLVYLVCLGIMHLLMPNMTPLDENLRRVA